jgi:hypothetical protein
MPIPSMLADWMDNLEVDGEIEKSVETVGLVETTVACVSIEDFSYCIAVGDVIHHLRKRIRDRFHSINTKTIETVSFDLH